jgi:ABC-2 type transport system ATP-binding protein
MTVIALREVSKNFRNATALRNVTLEIEEGQTYGLVGPNGSGKSVLLKLMCGFLIPDAGEVTIDPRYLDRRRTFPDRFGVTINGPGYIAGVTARQNLAELAAIRKRASLDDISRMLLTVGLDPDSKQRVRAFSMGMKQKLSLAQAFMEDPAVLILDEPFNALDEASVIVIKNYLRDQKAAGTTIVFTSHQREDVDELADAVFQIRNGEVSRE